MTGKYFLIEIIHLCLVISHFCTFLFLALSLSPSNITTQTNFDSTAHSKIYIVSAVVGIDGTLGAEKASSFTVQTYQGLPPVGCVRWMRR